MCFAAAAAAAEEEHEHRQVCGRETIQTQQTRLPLSLPEQKVRLAGKRNN